MNILMKSTIKQTPIEIALELDNEGKTTAKKLYAFLELNPSNYSKWCKVNIVGNEFAEEGIDFHSYQSTNEGRGNFAEDYKLTARFAKKLSMTQKNHKGELAREYFASVEDKAKEMANTLYNLSPEIKAIFIHDRKIQQVEHKVEVVQDRIRKLENNMTVTHEQIQVIKNRVNSKIVGILGGEDSNAYQSSKLRGRAYSRINNDYCDYFRINARANTLTAKYDEALRYIDEWKPDTNLRIEIECRNAQINMGVQ